MLRKLTITGLAMISVGCAHQAPKADASASQEEAAEQREYAKTLAAQLDSADVQEYAVYLCGLPQPERYEKALAFLASNHLLAACAFDAEHPVPKEASQGPVGIMTPPPPK
jgi:hypothetical protein